MHVQMLGIISPVNLDYKIELSFMLRVGRDVAESAAAYYVCRLGLTRCSSFGFLLLGRLS